MGRQLRVGGMGRVIGFDMTTAFPMGTALGLPAYLIAEFLPDIEAAMMNAVTARESDQDE